MELQVSAHSAQASHLHVALCPSKTLPHPGSSVLTIALGARRHQDFTPTCPGTPEAQP